MSLSIGIIGLPNVGKSTAFNALTGTQIASVANYPFCTIEPNRAIVPLPDERLDRLGLLVNASEIIHSTVEFVDIAGLVKGASKGEGLGNKFLAQIRDSAAILHIVRCFEDPNVVHVSEKPDPLADIETIEVELALADLEQLERKVERLTSAVKGDKGLGPTLSIAESLCKHLAAGKPVTSFADIDNDIFRTLNLEMRFLTGKPVLYIANVDENSLGSENICVEILRDAAKKRGFDVIVLCAKLEQELVEMDEDERSEYLQLAGVDESGLEQVIRKSYEMLNLISFFTFNEREARAWNIPKGATAPQAAGVIHTDFERGFIRAEVVPFEIFEDYGSSATVKTAGLMRLEGKDYVVQDGDVIYFRFNV